MHTNTAIIIVAVSDTVLGVYLIEFHHRYSTCIFPQAVNHSVRPNELSDN